MAGHCTPLKISSIKDESSSGKETTVLSYSSTNHNAKNKTYNNIDNHEDYVHFSREVLEGQY